MAQSAVVLGASGYAGGEVVRLLAIERAKAAGEVSMQGLAAIFSDDAGVRGRGLLIGVALTEAKARAVAQAALERGLLVNDATPSVVRLTPPLVITDDETRNARDSRGGGRCNRNGVET